MSPDSNTPDEQVYEAPRVELLGDLKDLTQNMVTGPFTDNMALMPMGSF